MREIGVLRSQAEESSPFRAPARTNRALALIDGPAAGSAMQVQLNYGPEGQRIVDMAHNAVGDTLATFIKDFPNYGDGAAYWSVNRNDNGSLPLTTFALDRALLDWGLVQEASEKVGFYLSVWVDADGFINQNPPGAQNSGWMYSCPLGFPDGLSDFGQLLELWVQVARARQSRSALAYATSPDQWIQANLPKALALANFTLQLRRNATANTPAGSSYRGLIWGPGEHDTCHSPDYYFSSSMWAWRGMVELSRWLRAAGIQPALSAVLQEEASSFATDITMALDASTVRDPSTGQVLFVPPIAGVGQTPFTSMTENTESSYSNFRCLSPPLSDSLCIRHLVC